MHEMNMHNSQLTGKRSVHLYLGNRYILNKRRIDSKYKKIMNKLLITMASQGVVNKKYVM